MPSKKFGMYVAFPIGIMWYFGTNLDNRFSVPDFWPKPEQTNKIPFERSEIEEELARMRAQRLERRAIRLEREAKMQELEGGRAIIHGSSESQERPSTETPSSRGILSYLGLSR